MNDHIAPISEQARLFLGSAALGLPIGLLLDAFRLLRALFPHHAIAVFIEDTAFVCISMLILQCYGIMFAHGSIRGYFAIGAVLGLAVYLLTIGAVWMRMLKKIKARNQHIKRRFCTIRKRLIRFFVEPDKNQPNEKESHENA